MVDKMANMNISRQAHGICSIGKFIYVVGGLNADCYTDTVERYDTEFNVWEDLLNCKLPEPCFSLTVVPYKKRYVIGMGDFNY